MWIGIKRPPHTRGNNVRSVLNNIDIRISNVDVNGQTLIYRWYREGIVVLDSVSVSGQTLTYNYTI